MNKADLIATVAMKADLSKKDAGEALDAVLDTIVAAVKKDDKVTLPGFGSFDLRARAARTGRNPQTGATIKVAATKVPGFKAGAQFKQAVSGKKAAAPAKKAAKKSAKKR